MPSTPRAAASSSNFGTSAVSRTPTCSRGELRPSRRRRSRPRATRIRTKARSNSRRPERWSAEIPSIVENYRAAQRALEARFDGVEIHGANGYLPDQFLQDGSNTRTDEYGGSVENRTRFLLEVTQVVASVWRGDRVGVRLAPSGTYGYMHDSNPERTFGYVAEQMNRFGLAYLHVIEPRIKGNNTSRKAPSR